MFFYVTLKVWYTPGVLAVILLHLNYCGDYDEIYN